MYNISVLADKRTDSLDLEISMDKVFAERVNLDQTAINDIMESTEYCDHTDITLRDRFTGIKEDGAARSGTKSGMEGWKEIVDCTWLN
jgi:hypothetical protein